MSRETVISLLGFIGLLIIGLWTLFVREPEKLLPCLITVAVVTIVFGPSLKNKD